MVALNFNANNFAPSTGRRDVFEDGIYLFHITGSKTTPTKDKQGTRLIFTFSCIEEGHAGKKFEEGFNIVNNNPETVDIAMADLSAISWCVGVPNWTDTQQLHGKPLCLKLQKDTYTNGKGEEVPTNNLQAILDSQGNPAQAGTATGAPAAPTAPPAPTAPAAAPTAPVAAPVAAPPTAAAPAPVAAAAQPVAAPVAPVAAAEAPAGAPWLEQGG